MINLLNLDFSYYKQPLWQDSFFLQSILLIDFYKNYCCYHPIEINRVNLSQLSSFIISNSSHYTCLLHHCKLAVILIGAQQPIRTARNYECSFYGKVSFNWWRGACYQDLQSNFYFICETLKSFSNLSKNIVLEHNI